MITSRDHVDRQAMNELLEHVLQLCACALMEKVQSWEAVAQLLEGEASRCRKRSQPGELEYAPSDQVINEASNVIHDWHRLADYVDAQGSPIPLSLWGEKGSIESIAKLRSSSPDKVQEWLDLIVGVKAIRKVRADLYLPVNYTLMVSSSKQAMVRRGVKILNALVATLCRNVTDAVTEKEFERWAHVLHVDAREIPAFRKFLKVQGETFIKTVDSWLEARRNENPGQNAAEVLVEVFSCTNHHVVPGVSPTQHENSPNKRDRPRRNIGKTARRR